MAAKKPLTPEERTVATLKLALAKVEEKWGQGEYRGTTPDGKPFVCALGAIGEAACQVEGADAAAAAAAAYADAADADAAAYADADAAAYAYDADAAAYAYDADAAAYAYDADAYNRAGAFYRARADAYRAAPLLRACVGGPVVPWNDAKGRKKAEVVKAFQCAIAKAEGGE